MHSSVMTAMKVPLPKEVVRHWANRISSQVSLSAKQLNLSQTFIFTLTHLNPLLQMNRSTLKSLLPSKAFGAKIWKRPVLHWFYPNNITLLKSHVRGASFHLYVRPQFQRNLAPYWTPPSCQVCRSSTASCDNEAGFWPFWPAAVVILTSSKSSRRQWMTQARFIFGRKT